MAAKKHYLDDYEWTAVRRSEVQVGDLYANGGSVTEVIVGPHHDPSDKWMSPKRGEVLIRCGPNFACKGKNTAKLVVGRRRG
jgi:hypothetical protein